MLLFDTFHLSVSYDPLHHWLFVEWRGRQDAQTSQADCELILHYAVEHRCRKVLCDSSAARTGWNGLAQWVSQDYFPRLATAGVRAVAWINAPDLVSKTEIFTIVCQTQTPAITAFEYGDQAYDWLRDTYFLP